MSYLQAAPGALSRASDAGQRANERMRVKGVNPVDWATPTAALEPILPTRQNLPVVWLALLTFDQNLINQSKFLGLVGIEILVARRGQFDLGHRAARVLGENIIQLGSLFRDLGSQNFNVGNLSAHLTPRFVHHYLRVGQNVALALGSGCKNDRRAAGGQTHAIRGNRAFQELHGVVNRQRGRDRAAGRIDVKVDFLVLVFVLQEEQLLNNNVGRDVVNDRLVNGRTGTPNEDDAVLEQQIAERHLPLPGVIPVALQLRLPGRTVGGEIVHEGNLPSRRGV